MAQEAFEKDNKNRKMPDLRSIHKEEKTPVKERLKNEIGFVEIEKENILLPIFSGTSEKELRDGVGIVEDTDIPSSKLGNTSVLAGHRGGYNGEQSFLNIDKLEEGDKIKVSTTSGKLQYKVLNKKIIKNDDWSHFYRENDKSKLILMTCHPYPTNKERLLVISELEK